MTDEPSPLKPSQTGIQSNATKFIHFLWIWLVRLLILGVGTGVSIGVGVAIAVMRPNWIWQPSIQNNISTSNQRFTLSADALFDSGKVTIRPEGYKLLDQVAAQLPLNNGRVIRIVGHGDVPSANSSLADNSLDLSYRRAISVKEYLARLRGEASYYWIVVGYGASQPLAPNNSENNRKTNRRIELIVSDS